MMVTLAGTYGGERIYETNRDCNVDRDGVISGGEWHFNSRRDLRVCWTRRQACCSTSRYFV